MNPREGRAMENTNLGLVAGNVLNLTTTGVETVFGRKVRFKGGRRKSRDSESSEKDSNQSTYHRRKTLVKRDGGGVSPLKEALVPELEVRTGFGMWPLKSHLSQWLLAADKTGIVKAVKSAFHTETLISFSLAMDYLFRMILGGRGNANSSDR